MILLAGVRFSDLAHQPDGVWLVTCPPDLADVPVGATVTVITEAGDEVSARVIFGPSLVAAALPEVPCPRARMMAARMVVPTSQADAGEFWQVQASGYAEATTRRSAQSLLWTVAEALALSDAAAEQPPPVLPRLGQWVATAQGMAQVVGIDNRRHDVHLRPADGGPEFRLPSTECAALDSESSP